MTFYTSAEEMTLAMFIAIMANEGWIARKAEPDETEQPDDLVFEQQEDFNEEWFVAWQEGERIGANRYVREHHVPDLLIVGGRVGECDGRPALIDVHDDEVGGLEGEALGVGQARVQHHLQHELGRRAVHLAFEQLGVSEAVGISGGAA